MYMYINKYSFFSHYKMVLWHLEKFNKHFIIVLSKKLKHMYCKTLFIREDFIFA